MKRSDIMTLDKFSDLYKLSEYDEVDFIARITNIIHPEDINDRVIVYFFDGTEHNRFTVFTNNEAIREVLYIDTVYKLYGVARGLKHRYFMLKGFEPVDVTLDIETVYYPERFKHPTDMMKLIYDTSIAKIKDTGIRQLVGYSLGIITSGYCGSEKQKMKYNRFIQAPASLNHHDSYSGGFVAHVAGMLAIVDKLEEIYTSKFRLEEGYRINWDILRAIVYLHDVGKPLTYTRESSGHYVWNENCLEDHAQLGSQYLYHCWRKTMTVEYAVIQKILYCVTEHMSINKQYDNKKVPELRILRAIDTIDTAIVTMLM